MIGDPCCHKGPDGNFDCDKSIESKSGRYCPEHSKEARQLAQKKSTNSHIVRLCLNISIQRGEGK